jgi:hypothetical protein
MKILFHSILFTILFLTIWAVAMPTPRAYDLTYQSEVRGYYDELGARSVGELELVPRKIRVPGFIKKIGNGLKKAGKAIGKGLKAAVGMLSPVPLPFR